MAKLYLASATPSNSCFIPEFQPRRSGGRMGPVANYIEGPNRSMASALKLINVRVRDELTLLT